MTEHGHNFIREIAEAYRALEQEQALLERIRELEARLQVDGQTIAHREERIHQLKGEVESLTHKLRSVEAERDDAGFRLLEAEDRVDAIKRALGVPEMVASAVAKREAAVREELTATQTPPQVVELSSTQSQPQTPPTPPVASPNPIAPSGSPSEPSTASTGDVGSQESASTTGGQVSEVTSPEQVREVPAEHRPSDGLRFGSGSASEPDSDYHPDPYWSQRAAQ